MNMDPFEAHRLLTEKLEGLTKPTTHEEWWYKGMMELGHEIAKYHLEGRTNEQIHTLG